MAEAPRAQMASPLRSCLEPAPVAAQPLMAAWALAAAQQLAAALRTAAAQTSAVAQQLVAVTRALHAAEVLQA